MDGQLRPGGLAMIVKGSAENIGKLVTTVSQVAPGSVEVDGVRFLAGPGYWLVEAGSADLVVAELFGGAFLSVRRAVAKGACLMPLNDGGDEECITDKEVEHET